MEKDTNNYKNKIFAQAHSSLALVKYWGKLKRGINIPACTSIAVTLKGLDSTLALSRSTQNKHSLVVNGVKQKTTRLEQVLTYMVKKKFCSPQVLDSQKVKNVFFNIDSKNSFPTSSGLASSASGGAAITLALLKYFQLTLPKTKMSELARVYSGSACRSVFGGFVEWEKGSLHANTIVKEDFWKEFRVLALVVTKKKKEFTSRDAMIHTTQTSPYYKTWLQHNSSLIKDVKSSIRNKDISKLGELITKSYTAMHASMFASFPPLLYWTPKTIKVLEEVRFLQKNNVPVWETMDAGPQVKLITLAKHVKKISSHFRSILPSVTIFICKVGGDAHVYTKK